jgi:hypothetical protein
MRPRYTVKLESRVGLCTAQFDRPVGNRTALRRLVKLSYYIYYLIYKHIFKALLKKNQFRF